MTARADALYELASLVETESSARAALMRWHEVTEDPFVAKVGRRARMGAPLRICLEPLEQDVDGALIARAIEAHLRHGGSLSHTLRGLVAAMESRDQLLHGSLSASSASKLSTRLLAGLAVTCALLIPGWHRTPVRVLVLSAAAALILAGAGTIWMRRLLPRPPAADDPVASTADLLAALLDAGLAMDLALDVACPLPARRTRRLVGLGMSWPDALVRGGPNGFETMANVLRCTYGSGSPRGRSLEAGRLLTTGETTSRVRDRDETGAGSSRASTHSLLPSGVRAGGGGSARASADGIATVGGKLAPVKRTLVCALVATVLIGACSRGEPAGTRPEPRSSATFRHGTAIIETDGGAVLVNIEVADSPELQARGLMGRESLDEDSGMLFLFFQDTSSSFWMKDTSIPLSIGFFDRDGTIVKILDMEPCEADLCSTYDPGVMYRGVLEVNQGAFEEWGVVEGDRIRVSP